MDSKGDFEKVRVALNMVMPSSIGDWWCITMDKRELVKFKGHQLQPMVAAEQVVVPHFKGLVKNYRASFPMMEPQITKVSSKKVSSYLNKWIKLRLEFTLFSAGGSGD